MCGLGFDTRKPDESHRWTGQQPGGNSQDQCEVSMPHSVTEATVCPASLHHTKELLP